MITTNFEYGTIITTNDRITITEIDYDDIFRITDLDTIKSVKQNIMMRDAGNGFISVQCQETYYDVLEPNTHYLYKKIKGLVSDEYISILKEKCIICPVNKIHLSYYNFIPHSNHFFNLFKLSTQTEITIKEFFKYMIKKHEYVELVCPKNSKSFVFESKKNTQNNDITFFQTNINTLIIHKRT